MPPSCLLSTSSSATIWMPMYYIYQVLITKWLTLSHFNNALVLCFVPGIKVGLFETPQVLLWAMKKWSIYPPHLGNPAKRPGQWHVWTPNSPSIWVWLSTKLHMIVIPLHSTPTSHSVGSTASMLNPHLILHDLPICPHQSQISWHLSFWNCKSAGNPFPWCPQCM